MGTPTRPAVVIDPGRQFGAPRIDGTRVPALRAADACWDGHAAADVAIQLGLTREQVLVACWFVTRYSATDYQRKLWRRRWGAWAAEYDDAFGSDFLRSGKADGRGIPDPPSPNRPDST